MKKTSLLTALVGAVVLAAPLAAHAEPPVAGGVKCESAVKKRYRLGAVAKRGLPVRITCTGPATVAGFVDFPAMTPQANDLLLMFPGGLPGITSGKTQPARMDAAGTATVRVYLTPVAARIAKRYPRTKLTVLMLVEREDERLWSVPAQNKRTVLIR
jgi:hypothetical protein